MTGAIQMQEETGLELIKIQEVLQATVIVGADLTGRRIKCVYASDLMSDVLAYGKPGSLLLTGLNTVQAVISSHMTEFVAIAVLRGKIPSGDMKRFAEDKHIIMLASPMDTYEACREIDRLQSSPAVCSKGAMTIGKPENVNLHSFQIDGGDFASAGMVSTQIKSILKTIGYHTKLIRRVAIATYEGEMNVVMHAKMAEVTLTTSDNEIVVVINDVGKGIPDIEQAMQEGFSTATREQQAMGFGAGMGLPNMKKNSDELIVSSEVGKGTRVEMKFKVA
ncbi:MAG: ATP-binding protein [Candidatus Eremiobacteraeota bacterium]|nr:ATP-binding protein [Candidatus Eremiobacteraeota bacterium]